MSRPAINSVQLNQHLDLSECHHARVAAGRWSRGMLGSSLVHPAPPASGECRKGAAVLSEPNSPVMTNLENKKEKI